MEVLSFKNKFEVFASVRIAYDGRCLYSVDHLENYFMNVLLIPHILKPKREWLSPLQFYQFYMESGIAWYIILKAI